MAAASTVGAPIVCKAAVMWEPKAPLAIEEVRIGLPLKDSRCLSPAPLVLCPLAVVVVDMLSADAGHCRSTTGR